MHLALQSAIQPVLQFGPIPLMWLADFPEGASCSIPPDDQPGTLAVPGPPIPPGSIVCFIPPEVATHLRPTLQHAKAQGAREAAIEVNGAKVYIYADMPQGGQPYFTAGMTGLGAPVRTHAVPRGSMIAVLLGDLAARIRPDVLRAINAARLQEIQGHGNGVVRP